MISVIIVSRHRPDALCRCILGLSQQDHQNFEVIVVADPEAAELVGNLDHQLKIIPFDQANISAARNQGLAAASGNVVAFVDDDAVPEPTWLSRLCAPFSNAEVVAATGFVRGRNGISYQWKASEVDGFGQDHPFDVTQTTVLRGTRLRCVKTQGTNCAFRRAALCDIGGFDPAFRFFLDEADVNLRLADLGATAIVPDAQVHHGYQASARRSADRVPLSLFDIAASTAVFLRKHAPDPDIASALATLSKRESLRIEGHRRAGRLSEAAELNLLRSLAEGWANGLAIDIEPFAAIPPANQPALRFSSFGPAPGRHLAGRFWQKRKLTEAARKSAQTHVTTVFFLSPTVRPHHLRFDPAGFWLQTGGIFGRSDRTEPLFRLTSFRRRLAVEVQRLAKYRPIL